MMTRPPSLQGRVPSEARRVGSDACRTAEADPTRPLTRAPSPEREGVANDQLSTNAVCNAPNSRNARCTADAAFRNRCHHRLLPFRFARISELSRCRPFAPARPRAMEGDLRALLRSADRSTEFLRDHV